MARPIWLKPLPSDSLLGRGEPIPGRRNGSLVWVDFGVPALVLAVLTVLALGARQTFGPLSHVQPISLNPALLPGHAVRTVLRMLAAMIASLLFTLTYGTLAAKSRRAGMVLIPLLDIVQSVPVLGYYRSQ